MFVRSKLNPILSPNGDWWKIYNPAAALDDQGNTHIFPRVMKKETDWHSRIAHAISSDGEHFEWMPDPVLVRQHENEIRGLEDPRITRIADAYYMVFGAYDGRSIQLQTATTHHLMDAWQRHGQALPDFNFFKSEGKTVHWEQGKPVYDVHTEHDIKWSKSGALFPDKIGGKFQMLFGDFHIWSATSDDGVTFQVAPTPLIGPREGTSYFDNIFVETGPPPILTEKGWLVLYHGIDEVFRYQLGFLILDTLDPSKILYRCEKPIFSPQEEYEIGDALIDVLSGGIHALHQMDEDELKAFYTKAREENVMPQVIFCPGAILKKDMLWLYYGAGDTSICTAWAPLSEILKRVP